MRKPRIGAVTIVVVIATGVVFWLCADLAPQNAKLSHAQLRARALADACAAYALDSASGGAFPKVLTDLLNPSFKNGTLLMNGKADLLDPWGNPYRYEVRSRPGGEPFPFVATQSPEGVDISQFGIGPKAQPPF